jgi:His-Xaa-Ser repeat protein HxsA
VVHSPHTNQAGGLTNASRVNRTGDNQGRATAALDRTRNRGGSVGARNGQASRTAAPRPSNEAALSRQHHIFARESGAQHRDWDRRHAHFFNGHWWCWDGGFWIGLDDGFYPWDFYPYYASDYYPYDYYTDVESDYQAYTGAQVDPTVSNVQSELAQLGYYNGPIDGIFGADTRTALTRYQMDNHLQVTGSLTSDKLQSLGLPEPAAS